MLSTPTFLAQFCSGHGFSVSDVSFTLPCFAHRASHVATGIGEAECTLRVEHPKSHTLANMSGTALPVMDGLVLASHTVLLGTREVRHCGGKVGPLL